MFNKRILERQWLAIKFYYIGQLSAPVKSNDLILFHFFSSKCGIFHYSCPLRVMMIDLSSKIFSFCQIKEEKIRPLLGGACDPTFWQLEEMFQIRIRVFELILVFSYIFVVIFFLSKWTNCCDIELTCRRSTFVPNVTKLFGIVINTLIQ